MSALHRLTDEIAIVTMAAVQELFGIRIMLFGLHNVVIICNRKVTVIQCENLCSIIISRLFGTPLLAVISR